MTLSNFQAASGDGELSLSWVLSAVTGKNVVVRWGLLTLPVNERLLAASATSYVITGLVNGQVYSVSVSVPGQTLTLLATPGGVTPPPPPPPPPPGSWPQSCTAWTPVGALPMSDAAAAALVVHQPEQRPGNAAANVYAPAASELAAFHAASPTDLNDQLRQYVTGRSGLINPSTDDLIQWATAKWGIPTDWIRAEAVQESHWHQTPDGFGLGLGDSATVTPAQYALYPASARVPGKTNTVYQSMGIMQCKWLAVPGNVNADTNSGTEPLRWKSTAFCLDYQCHYIRWLFDGYPPAADTWIPEKVYKGNEWASLGGWFGGGGNAAAQKYIADVQAFLASKPWTKAGF